MAKDNLRLDSLENSQAQMRKGLLEYCILLVIARGQVYASDILQALKQDSLIVVEGTLYPLLSRLRQERLVDYEWRESKNGPPRKYYSLTELGQDFLNQLDQAWSELTQSIASLRRKQ